MEPRCLPHPIERLLLAFTLAAFLGIVYWKAGEAPLPRPAALAHAL